MQSEAWSQKKNSKSRTTVNEGGSEAKTICIRKCKCPKSFGKNLGPENVFHPIYAIHSDDDMA